MNNSHLLLLFHLYKVHHSESCLDALPSSRLKAPDASVPQCSDQSSHLRLDLSDSQSTTMPPIRRKRRAVRTNYNLINFQKSNGPKPVEESESESESDNGAQTLPERSGNRSRVDQSPISDVAYDEEEEEEEGAEGSGSSDSVDNIARKLVRYALSCEYSRQPIRKADIGQKVLGTNGRQFKAIFGEAQNMLRTTFGMEMTELPIRENVTIAERRGMNCMATVVKVRNANRVVKLRRSVRKLRHRPMLGS